MMRLRSLLKLIPLVASLSAACSGTSGPTPEHEQATAAHMTSIEGDPTQLAAFLTAMPKGGDLHNHLSGAVYAETYLDWAATAKDCIETATGNYYLSIDSCGYAGDVAIPATTDPLYTQTVEAMSMLNFVATASESGHDHFFATFGLYGAMSGTAHHAAGLADVLTRGANENEVYIETMLTSNSTAEDARHQHLDDAERHRDHDRVGLRRLSHRAAGGVDVGIGGRRHHQRHRQHRERREVHARLQRRQPASACGIATRYQALYLAQRRGAGGVRADGGRVRSGEGRAAPGRAQSRRGRRTGSPRSRTTICRWRCCST